MRETNKEAFPENTNMERTLTNLTSDETERVKMQDKSDKVNVFEDIPISQEMALSQKTLFPHFKCMA